MKALAKFGYLDKMLRIWSAILLFGIISKCASAVINDFQAFQRIHHYSLNTKISLLSCGPDDQCRFDRAEGSIRFSLSSLPSKIKENIRKYLTEKPSTNLIQQYMEPIYEKNLEDRFGPDIPALNYILKFFFNSRVSVFYKQLMNSRQPLSVIAGEILGNLRRELAVTDTEAWQFWDSINTLAGYGNKLVKRVLFGNDSSGKCGSVFNPNVFRSIPSAFSSMRVINGLPILKGEYKFLVSLMYNGRIVCTATIIDSTHILTAAHCTLRASARHLSVGIAEYDVSTSDGERVIQVSRISRHPSYDNQKNNDICILTLAEPLVGVANAEPVCMPRGTQCQKLKNRYCRVIGWGASEKVGGKLRFPSIPRDAVVRAYDGTLCPYKKPPPSVPSRQICAIGNADTCNGDSGGPLVCKYGGSWVQCGITSYGPTECNKPETNGVYTNVRKYKQWIDTITS